MNPFDWLVALIIFGGLASILYLWWIGHFDDRDDDHFGSTNVGE
jgi:hypothetical protein